VKKLCPICSKGEIVEKTIQIPIGRQTFETLAQACEACGVYAVTPQLQKKIDEWGNGFKKSFIEVQPILTDVVRSYVAKKAEAHALNSVDIIRLFTVFYLKEARSYQNFSKIDKLIRESEAVSLFKNRERKPVSIPIRYAAFKLMNRASKVLDLQIAQIMEEAVNFCVALKHLEDTSELKQIIAMLDQFVEDHALAA
jgi:hypothetical protein